MKRKNKNIICLILILMLFIIQTKVVNAKVEVTPGGAPTPPASGCDECSWTYASNGLGVRLSLYKYDGKNLVFKKSIDLVNQPSAYPSKVNTTKNKYGRYNYTKLNQTMDFGYYKVGAVDINNYGLSTIDEDTTWSSTFANEILKYYGDNATSTINGIKKMFGINVTQAELSQYYIVAEPTAFFHSRVGQFYTYATGYEYMTILKDIDVYTGDYDWNLWESQGRVTFLGYLYNGMYNQTNSSKKYPGAKDGRYDYYNFLAQESNTSIVKTTSSILSHKDQLKKDNAYKASNYPYGVMVFWIGQNGNIGCKGVCNNLKGDALLKCAENYCSSLSNIKDSNGKANCITNTCGYTYNKLSCGNTNSVNGNDTTCSSKTTSSKESCQIINSENFSYKVECTTSSTTIYPTTLPTTIMPGTGFEYQVKLYGNKTCTITFDTESWKYNYAASYTNAERNNYIEAINNFNRLSLSSYVYKSSNANISIKINEKTNGDSSTTTKTLKKENEYYRGSDDVTSIYTNKNVTSFHKNIAKTLSVKTYITDSSNGTLYNLPGVCISAKDNVSVKEGSTCENGLGPYNKYFTGIYADSTTNATETKVTHSIAGMDTTNKCNYKVADNKLSCYITVETKSGQTGNILINNEDIVFTLYAVNGDKSKKITYNLGDTIKGKGDVFNNLQTKTIYRNTIRYNDDQIIYGTVTDGTNYAYCKKEITITPNACNFEVIENSNNTKTIKLKPINNPNAEYYIKDSTSNKWMYMNAKTISNNTKITIWGMVKVGNNKNYCVINFPTDENKTCTDLYKPTEYSKIKNYCENNWQKDRKGYSSYNDCYTDCTNPPGKNTCKSLYTCSDIKAIRQYCKVNYQVDGYKTMGNCINDCSCGSNGLKYYYRTISLNNPFPDREAHYNWIGYEEYITNDIEDNTPSTNSSGPEYEIVLDSKRINAIKKHTKKYISEGNDAYGDFIRASKKDTGKYKSKFIHVDDIEEGGFSTYFTYIEGSKTGG